MTNNVGVTSVQRLDVDAAGWKDLGEPKCSKNTLPIFDVSGPIAAIATDASLCAFAHDGEWRLLGNDFGGPGNTAHDVSLAGSVSGPIFVAWRDVSAEPAVVRAVAFTR
jgi:hypothetical protein